MLCISRFDEYGGSRSGDWRFCVNLVCLMVQFSWFSELCVGD